MITHYQAVRGGYSHVRGVRATADDVFMGILPLCHSYGCGTTLIQPVLIQASVILLETFNAEQALKAIDAQKPTLQHGAPAHYIMEMNHPNLDRYNLSSLRAGYLAGQICPEEVIQWGEDRNIYLSSSWGNSEVGPGAGTMCPFGTPLEVRKKSVGKPIPGTQVKVIDPDTGKRIGTGEVGEMMVKGPNVLKGYWQNPEETDKQLEKDGWLHTGDLISDRREGFYHDAREKQGPDKPGWIKDISLGDRIADSATSGRIPSLHRRNAKSRSGRKRLCVCRTQG